MTVSRREALRWGSMLVAAGALGACQNPRGVWPKLRVGYLPIAAELPLFVALEQGFFTVEKLAVELVRLPSSNDLATAAAADRVDILAGAALSAVFDAGTVSKKRALLFATNPYSNRPGFVTDHVIVRDQARHPTLQSLKGTRIASFPGSVNRVFVKLLMAKHGVPWGAYQYLEMQPKEWQPALASGAIDAVSAIEPSATQILADGVGFSIFPGFYADLMNDVPLSGHWIAADFAKRADPAQIAAVLRAYDRAIDFIRADPLRAKAYLPKYANVRPDIASRVNLNPWQKRGEIDPAKMQAFIDLLWANEALLGHVAADQYLLPN